MIHYEQLGVFYLGRKRDLAAGRNLDELILYDSKDLTTHGVIVGMTGSGKTGLGITLLEEAAIDSIPAIVIDPKGDMGNLLLNFPDLSPADLFPWIDQGEALRKGMNPREYADHLAEVWRNGLEAWNQPIDRIARLRDAAEVAIYTPGSTAGIPLKVLQSFSAPSEAIRNSADDFRDRLQATVSGLLALLKINADPVRSREHILLSNILQTAWQQGRSLGVAELIHEIQTPSFQKLGVMDLDTVFPPADRAQLALMVNNLLASPGFSTWMEGEPLNIQRLLYTPEGHPRIAVISIAHLSEPERMFFVTLLLNEVISWMRSLSGTSSLRALLYMDEVFGYLPPTANPPSKLPMLTLLKQARAFGVGLILATQNPVDLDYKALSNAGTWFLGRLQTERDKARVLDGLEGASTVSGSAFDRARIEKILSGLGNRVFLMNNVHEDEPVVFQTRWALSFLRGPLTRDQIERLMAPYKAAQAQRQPGETALRVPSSAPATAPDTSGAESGPMQTDVTALPAEFATSSLPPILPPTIIQKYLPLGRHVQVGSVLEYRPALMCSAKLRYADARSKIDEWHELVLVVPVHGEPGRDPWDEAELWNPREFFTENEPAGEALYSELPPDLYQPRSYTTWKSSLKTSLYRTRRLSLWYNAAFKLYSLPGESDGEFRVRLAQLAREQRDVELEKLRSRHAREVQQLSERLRKAEQRVDRQKSQAQAAKTSAGVSFVQMVLGALMGRKVQSMTNVSRAATTARAAGRASQRGSEVERAEEDVRALQADLDRLAEVLEQETDQIRSRYEHVEHELSPYDVAPRKTDILVGEVTLLWMPWEHRQQELPRPAWDETLHAPHG